jgi:ATP-binding cassette subfamily C (CFTR/MRP) protein 4
MVSTERVLEYTDLPAEAAVITATTPPPNWPTKGKLEFKNMSMTYPSLQEGKSNPPVLRNLDLVIEPGMQIGVIGRTGAGKSSLLQALFRIVEPSPERSIILDGIATSDLGLKDLRSSISIIPQEPFCFKGTLRFNLDPFGKYSDQDLWSVLEAVELKNTISAIPEGLEAPVSENGSNWSVGERQVR